MRVPSDFSQCDRINEVNVSLHQFSKSRIRAVRGVVAKEVSVVHHRRLTISCRQRSQPNTTARIRAEYRVPGKAWTHTNVQPFCVRESGPPDSAERSGGSGYAD